MLKCQFSPTEVPFCWVLIDLMGLTIILFVPRVLKKKYVHTNCDDFNELFVNYLLYITPIKYLCISILFKNLKKVNVILTS